MTKLILVFGDQLSSNISSLRNCNQTNDIILMSEVYNEATHVKHHKKKLVLIFSAMRHFAKELNSKGYNVKYIYLNENIKSFTDAIDTTIQKNKIKEILLTEPSEYRVTKEIKTWQSKFSINIQILEDDRFLCSREEFKNFALNKKQLIMETFYRNMRKKYNILMQNGKPVGGKWNFDKENRNKAPNNLNINFPLFFKIDEITKEVILLVNHKFNDHFGDLENFNFATKRTEALKSLHYFIQNRLSLFGKYQDSMLEGHPWMFHSHISMYINLGLLLPNECINAAENAYHQGLVPINAAEGFIRQILGWREYINGVYWLKMPKYQNLNFLNAKKNLPQFYWTAETKLNCLKQCINETQQNAYAHHIQRLMILGNFLLLIGTNPRYVNEWYLIVYADAFEWVEMPNVNGMVLYADEGLLSSKPYAASGAYINKMSNYCKNCSYNVKEKNGPSACPFNYLYWNFLIKNKNKLKTNHRMKIIYSTLDKMPKEKIDSIKADSRCFIESI